MQGALRLVGGDQHLLAARYQGHLQVVRHAGLSNYPLLRGFQHRRLPRTAMHGFFPGKQYSALHKHDDCQLGDLFDVVLFSPSTATHLFCYWKTIVHHVCPDAMSLIRV